MLTSDSERAKSCLQKSLLEKRKGSLSEVHIIDLVKPSLYFISMLPIKFVTTVSNNQSVIPRVPASVLFCDHKLLLNSDATSAARSDLIVGHFSFRNVYILCFTSSNKDTSSIILIVGRYIYLCIFAHQYRQRKECSFPVQCANRAYADHSCNLFSLTYVFLFMSQVILYSNIRMLYLHAQLPTSRQKIFRNYKRYRFDI